MARLARSAAQLAFNVDLDCARQLLIREAPPYQGAPVKVRLLATRDGTCRLDCQPIKPLERITLALARDPIDKDDAFLYHKTTNRTLYDHAKALRPDVGDVLLWNTRDEITETSMANIVVKLDSKLVTPPVECGLLPGTMRAHLLENGTILERVIPRRDITRATAVYLINSVRKWVPADLVR